MTPSSAPPCIRCGTFDVNGPAAEIGLGLCRPCYDRPVEPLVRANHSRAATYALLAPLGAFVLVCAGALIVDALAPQGALRREIESVGAFLSVTAAVGALASVLGVMAFAMWRARVPQGGLPLGIAPESIVPATAPTGIVTIATLHDEGEGSPGIPQMGIVCVTPRGVVLVGAALRLALPAGAVRVTSRRGLFQREHLLVELRGRTRGIACTPERMDAAGRARFTKEALALLRGRGGLPRPPA